MPLMRIGTTGPVSVELNGATPPAELLWKKHLALLVYLAASPRRTRSREHLIALLWGERPEASARHSLNEAVRLIRRYLGDDAIATGGPNVTLSPTAVELHAEGEGTFLEGFSIAGCPGLDEWLDAERLTRQRHGFEALTARADERLAAGDLAEATHLAEQALAMAPISEGAAQSLMRALALGGHGSLALGISEALARRLQEELGTEPSPETRALRDRISKGKYADRLPTPAAPAHRMALVGREREMSTLTAAIRESRMSQQASLSIVEGESGSGKTRLLQELVDRARLDGMTVAVARSIPAESSEQWSALAGLARGGLMNAPGIVAARPAALAAVASIDPEWAARAPARGDESPARALPEVLRAASDEASLLLALDDAQWADYESLGAIGAALRDLAGVPLAVIVCVRSRMSQPIIEEMRTRIGRELRGECVRLGPLDSDALEALAESALPDFSAGDRNRLVRRIAADSAGSPLLAAEILRAIAHGLDLGRASHAWPEAGRTLDDTMPSDLPDAVVASIRVNFRRLSADAQAALSAAAVLGDRSSEELIGRATGLATDRLVEALDELEWQRWLVVDGRGYVFAARLVRDVVARDFLTAGQRDRFLRRARLEAKTT